MTTSAPNGYNAQVPRPVRASVVGMPSGRWTRRNRDAGARTPSSATGRSPSYRILPGGQRTNTTYPPYVTWLLVVLVAGDAAAGRCRPVATMRQR